jgi:hypothetical protein
VIQENDPSGEEQLRAALRRHRDRARKDDPRPYDRDWGW